MEDEYPIGKQFRVKSNDRTTEFIGTVLSVDTDGQMVELTINQIIKGDIGFNIRQVGDNIRQVGEFSPIQWEFSDYIDTQALPAAGGSKRRRAKKTRKTRKTRRLRRFRLRKKSHRRRH